jgi:alpha-ketoglutarate-dependent taurine dioxygenase
MSKPEANLPLVVVNDRPRAASDAAVALLSWYGKHRERLEQQLLVHGALLFRGFGIDSQEVLERVVAGIGGKALDYVDGNSPRRKLGSGVYTSTDYPPEFFISLHNELSYSSRWPARLFFCCVTAPAEGGETPLADSRAILRRLRGDVREAFVHKDVKYVRNLHGGIGFGPSWQKTFETEDRGTVEEFFHGTETGLRWNEDGSLTVTQIRPAIATHPATGETVWFNQADQFHPSTHPKEIYDSILALYEGREDLIPQTALFGDGSPIDPAMLDEVRRTVGEEIRLFSWQQGDLLLIDNMLVAHGRRPFKPPRKILVSMTG